jgi:hypothetical protein
VRQVATNSSSSNGGSPSSALRKARKLLARAANRGPGELLTPSTRDDNASHRAEMALRG